jgi:hypothetical protein
MKLMQIVPGTWAEWRSRYCLGVDPYDPHDNILAGTAYIRELDDRYGALGLLAAYNAGPRRYARHLATGRLLSEQTQAYVATLAPLVGAKQACGKIVAVARSFTATGLSLFAARTVTISANDRPPHGVHPNRPRSDSAVVDLSALVPQSGNMFVRSAGEVRSQRSRSTSSQSIVDHRML